MRLHDRLDCWPNEIRYGLKISTFTSYQWIVNYRIVDTSGGMALTLLNGEVVRDSLARKLAYARIRSNILSVARTALDHVVEDALYGYPRRR